MGNSVIKSDPLYVAVRKDDLNAHSNSRAIFAIVTKDRLDLYKYLVSEGLMPTIQHYDYSEGKIRAYLDANYPQVKV